MKSQIALNSGLANPFALFDLESSPFEPLSHAFEQGKVLVIEGACPDEIDFFINLPKKSFPEWVPPVFDSKILRDIDDEHVLWNYYQDRELIVEFQKKMQSFQQSWEELHRKMFPSYKFADLMWSWRMNSMDLGFLHFDIPESNFKEQQMRSFINLSERPRIIEFGPTLEELVKKFFKSESLERFWELPPDLFIEKLKTDLLKKHNFEDLYLPRHYLTLAPGAMWICNAFLITHGLVFGEKTVCLEARIQPETLNNPQSHFHKIVDSIKRDPENSEILDFKFYD